MISPDQNLCQGQPEDGHGKRVTSRKEALAIGAKTYFTGKPCQRGHICERYASGGNKGKCVLCIKECRKRYMQTYRKPYYERNKERYKSYSRASYLRHREKHNESARLWRLKHPEEMRSHVAKWRNNNRDAFRASCRKWRRNNIEKVLHAARIRRAIKRGARGTHTAADIGRILKQQRGRCAYCRKKLRKYHVDHIIALANGGSNLASNLQILCRFCNSQKGSRDPLRHARLLGKLL